MTRGVLGPHHPFVSAEARERFLADYDRLAASSPLEWETATVETDCGATHVRSRGPQGGRPLVLLPGAGGDSVQWPTRLMAMLSNECRVHAVDNIVDFGRSVSSRPIRTTAECMTWLDELLRSISPGRAVTLIGGSRGAWLAAEYALHAPERLAATVWLSPALVVSGLSLGGLSFAPRGLLAMKRPSTGSVGGMLRWLLPRYAEQDPDGFRQMMVDHTTLAFQCFDTTEVGRGWGPRRFSASELRSIRVPALYLAGAEERLVSTKAAVARVNKVAPQIRTVILPGSGHDTIWVHPDEVARHILGFLGQAEAA